MHLSGWIVKVFSPEEPNLFVIRPKMPPRGVFIATRAFVGTSLSSLRTPLSVRVLSPLRKPLLTRNKFTYVSNWLEYKKPHQALRHLKHQASKKDTQTFKTECLNHLLAYVAIDLLPQHSACQTPHFFSRKLPEATVPFKQHDSACQKPRSVSEKMSKATNLFNGIHVCAGKFFEREEICGF